jgi:hypothetical protein
MASGHAATPNSECSQTVSAASEASQATVPEQLRRLTNGAGHVDASNDNKIVTAKPGV